VRKKSGEVKKRVERWRRVNGEEKWTGKWKYFKGRKKLIQ
jgi:hypothetical protein